MNKEIEFNIDEHALTVLQTTELTANFAEIKAWLKEHLNPFTTMIVTEDAIKEAKLENVKFHLLDDLKNESDNSHDWGFYLYSKVVTEIQQSNFTIYYSDGFEIITSWFPGFLLRNNVSLNLLARNATESGVSATLVRDMIMSGNPDLIKCVPTKVYNEREAIKSLIELSKLKR